MALRSLELWAQAMAESRQGPRRSRTTGRHAHREGDPVSKTEDRLAGTADDAGRRQRPASPRTVDTGEETRRLPLAAYVPMGVTSRYAKPEGDDRPGPLQVVDQAGGAHRHGAQGAVVQRRSSSRSSG